MRTTNPINGKANGSGSERVKKSQAIAWRTWKLAMVELAITVAGGALRDAKFDRIVGRMRNHEEIDRVIAEWTRDRDAAEGEQRLQASGGPAHVVSHARELLADHADELGPNVRWNTERGLELAVAEVSRATALLADLADRISAFFGTFDVLACPATQVVAFDVGLDWVHEVDGQPLRTYLDWMASAYLISATGLPAISVPAGFTPGGLPAGLQLVGRRRGDWPLLAVAHAFEAATGPGPDPQAPLADRTGSRPR